MLDAGAIPIVLGGDHSIAEPDIRACAAVHGPVGLIHFDTHTDTGNEVFGVEVSPRHADVPARRGGPRRPAARYVQIGLRGYWPGEKEFALAGASTASRAFFMHDVRDARHRRGRRAARRASSATARCSSRVDVDVLDPAFAPGHRHARARRDDLGRPALGVPRDRRELELVGADVVEVIPTAVGSADITALVAERIVREILTGIALRRG